MSRALHWLDLLHELLAAAIWARHDPDAAAELLGTVADIDVDGLLADRNELAELLDGRRRSIAALRRGSSSAVADEDVVGVVTRVPGRAAQAKRLRVSIRTIQRKLKALDCG